MAAPALARVVEREARVFRHLWRGSVFSGFLTPVLFLAAIGLGLGGLVEERSGEIDGLSYLHFVTPGLVVAAAMQVATGSSLWPVMAGTKWNRFFHGMVATPLSPGDVYGGIVIWNGLYTGLFAAAFLVVAALLGGVPSAWGVLALPAAMLCGLAFGAPLTAFAATQDTDLAFPVIMRLGIMPLFLFSGTFFPIEQLPGALQRLAVASPLWHAAELSRAATTGSFSPWPVAGHVGVLLACVVAGWWWGTRTFAARLTP